jgi:hypothetical protein
LSIFVINHEIVNMSQPAGVGKTADQGDLRDCTGRGIPPGRSAQDLQRNPQILNGSDKPPAKRSGMVRA